MIDQDLELTEEELEWCKANLEVHTHMEPVIIKLQARGDKAEWRYTHRDCVETKDGTILCTVGGGANRHTWKAAQWMEEAQREFSKRGF